MLILYFQNSAFDVIMSWSAGEVGAKENAPMDISEKIIVLLSWFCYLSYVTAVANFSCKNDSSS